MHPMYHLPWQPTAPDQARPPLQKRGGSEMKGTSDAPQSSCSLLAMSRHASRLMSPPLPVPWAAVPLSVWRLPSPLSMHGLSQNATRSPADRWGPKQWGSHSNKGWVDGVCDCVPAAYVPTAISSFPSVCMDLRSRPVGRAPSITSSQPIMLTDTLVESTPWLLIALAVIFMFVREAENR